MGPASSSNIVLRMMIIDNDPANFELLRGELAGEPVEVFTATAESEWLDLVRSKRPHVVLLGVGAQPLGGIPTLEKILEMDPGIDVIFMSTHYSTESAVEAIQRGACDYLMKPVPIAKLLAKIGELLSSARLRQRSRELDCELVDAFQFEGMVGRSPLMLEVFRKIHRVAHHFRTVLLTGDTGTGKELAARALYRLGPRASGPFVACNCSAWSESLLETELFGCVRGAFTGAVQDRKGIFEYANGGTLMLDEIGEVSLPTQARLLRVIENQEIQRVGSPVVHRVDVRVIAATSRNLPAMVAKNKFREDLYYRLSMVEIRLPPLADRKEDLPLLERYLVHSFATKSNKQIRGLTRRVQALLSRYSWPGNVRELENVIGHACIMTEADIIDVRDLPEHLRARQDGANLGPGKEEIIPLDEIQRRYTRTVVDRLQNKTQAADLLGISRTKLYRLLAAESDSKLQKSSNTSRPEKRQSHTPSAK
jgi:DNA-binding NtrC family response regulator